LSLTALKYRGSICLSVAAVLFENRGSICLSVAVVLFENLSVIIGEPRLNIFSSAKGEKL